MVLPVVAVVGTAVGIVVADTAVGVVAVKDIVACSSAAVHWK